MKHGLLVGIVLLLLLAFVCPPTGGVDTTRSMCEDSTAGGITLWLRSGLAITHRCVSEASIDLEEWELNWRNDAGKMGSMRLGRVISAVQSSGLVWEPPPR